MRILIADDSKFMRYQLKMICEKLFPEAVEEAGTGLEALRKCESFQPDLIFMDITMPQMDGVEATKRIKEKWGRRLNWLSAAPWLTPTTPGKALSLGRTR